MIKNAWPLVLVLGLLVGAAGCGDSGKDTKAGGPVSTGGGVVPKSGGGQLPSPPPPPPPPP